MSQTNAPDHGASPKPLSFAQLQSICAELALTAVAVIDPPTQLDATGYDQMLADGVGDLKWLVEQRERRLTPTFLLPEARSLIVVAWSYQSELAVDGDLKRGRYAAGKDYHRLLRERLGRLGVRLGGGQRGCVDSAPINERTLARLAGLGWIGRNALLIDPDAGSYRFLGVLLTTIDIERHNAGKDADRCGSCRACETACPTAALRDRRVLTERCISYLTIEHDGVIPRDLAERFDGWWFGCDRCQEVCPWNRFALAPADPRLTGNEQESSLFTITAETFDLYFAGRAVRRLGYARFRRNLLVALWSLGRHRECQPLLDEGLPKVLDQARELQLIA